MCHTQPLHAALHLHYLSSLRALLPWHGLSVEEERARCTAVTLCLPAVLVTMNHHLDRLEVVREAVFVLRRICWCV